MLSFADIKACSLILPSADERQGTFNRGFTRCTSALCLQKPMMGVQGAHADRAEGQLSYLCNTFPVAGTAS